MTRTVEFSIELGDILALDADVIALKYAQTFHGADKAVAYRLESAGIPLDRMQPEEGTFRYLETARALASRSVLFVGVPALHDFTYARIREFGKQVLAILAQKAPQTQHIAMTIHGPGYGLDEAEAVRTQLGGCMEALRSAHAPANLLKITFVERDEGRVSRLRDAIGRELLSTPGITPSARPNAYLLPLEDPTELYPEKDTDRLATALSTKPGSDADESPRGASVVKPHIFVAMPFSEKREDFYYYGLAKPINEAGFLCERVDKAAFVGDIMQRVREKIETASLVVADLSGANANVYLEVGYAWGVGRPVLLLIQGDEEAHYDVRGHRIQRFQSARNLELLMGKELAQLFH